MDLQPAVVVNKSQFPESACSVRVTKTMCGQTSVRTDVSRFKLVVPRFEICESLSLRCNTSWALADPAVSEDCCLGIERDSNPRYRFRYSGFQVRRRVLNRSENSLLYLIVQPLTSRTC